MDVINIGFPKFRVLWQTFGIHLWIHFSAVLMVTRGAPSLPLIALVIITNAIVLSIIAYPLDRYIVRWHNRRYQSFMSLMIACSEGSISAAESSVAVAATIMRNNRKHRFI